MTRYKRDGKVGPWAEEKLKCLGGYLSAYTTILRKQRWCEGYFYMDAFAGAGRAELRTSNGGKVVSEPPLLGSAAYSASDEEEISYLDGSPHVALNIKYPFTRYIFVEKHQDRASRLTAMAERYTDRYRIDIIQDDASCAIKSVLMDSSINWRRCRGIIFLDPFGMQVPWEIIDSIADNGKIEIFLNLPIGMTIQRLLPRSGRIDDKQRAMLNEYFGSTEWEDVIYERSADLFGADEISKAQRSGERFAYWYRDRLKMAFGHAPEPRLICNSRGSHLYYLLFAGPNKKGAEIASYVLIRGRRVLRPKNAKLKVF